MDTIPATSSKVLTKYTNFANYLLIVDTYSKIPILYGTENISDEGVMDKLDMFKERLGELDEFGWCYMERIHTNAGTKFTSKDFKEGLSVCGLGLAIGGNIT